MVTRIQLDEAPKVRIYLAEWRATKFETQQDLADAMNTTAAAVSRIETGARDWSKGYLEALAYLVGCRVGDLFQHPDTIRGKPQCEGRPQLSELMKLATSLPEKQIAGLIAFLGEHGAVAPREALAAEEIPARSTKVKSM